MIHHILFTLLLLTVVFLTIKTRKLTFSGSATAAVIAIAVYYSFGWSGIALLGSFFALGVAATTWNMKKAGTHETSTRNTAQVLANGGITAILAIIAALGSQYHGLCLLLAACSLSSATADTMSSELGNVYGSSFYNILSFRKDSRGENGVVSLEGTMLGLFGSLLTSLVYTATTGLWSQTWIVIVAGTIGNLCDSCLGATLERRGAIGNNTVNFLNTMVGATTGYLLFLA